VLSATICKR